MRGLFTSQLASLQLPIWQGLLCIKFEVAAQGLQTLWILMLSGLQAAPVIIFHSNIFLIHGVVLLRDIVTRRTHRKGV